VFWIRVGFDADPDPVFYFSADPDPGPGFDDQKSKKICR
jgi:hypothetical protein